MFFLPYRWKNVDNPCYTVRVRWSVPGAIKAELAELSVAYREYVPGEHRGLGDSTIQHWQVNGKEVKLVHPPYAVQDTVKLSTDVETFLQDSQPGIESCILEGYRQRVNDEA